MAGNIKQIVWDRSAQTPGGWCTQENSPGVASYKSMWYLGSLPIPQEETVKRGQNHGPKQSAEMKRRFSEGLPAVGRNSFLLAVKSNVVTTQRLPAAS